MKERGFINRLNDAIEGLISIFREQKNMKLHLLGGILILSAGVYLGLGKIDLILLILAVGIILIAEMVNSCFELILDFIHPDYHPMLRRIKNALAGTVLFSGLVAFIIIYFLFSSYFEPILENGFRRLKGAQWHLTFFSLLIVISIVIVAKAFFRKGKPLRGGIPSGHAALAFSIWTIITLLENNPLLSMLVFILALMISGSRLKEGIHNLWEVILGGALGFLVTITIFQFFNR